MTSQARLNTSHSASNFSQTSRLSDARRSRLEDLKKREELKGALKEKFQGRFATGNPDRPDDEVSVPSTTIRREIDNFAKTAQVTTGNLHRLDRRMQSRAKGRVPHNQSQVPSVSAYSCAGLSQRSHSATSLAGKNVISSGIPAAFDWAALDEYASYIHEQDGLRQKIGVQALQRKLKMDLDQQVNEKMERLNERAEEDRKHHENSVMELEKWKQQEQERAAEKHRQLMKEKEDRDKQLAYGKQLRAEEEDKKKQEEVKLVQKIVDEMEKEQKQHERKKEQRKKSMRKVFEENAADQVAKEKARREAERAECEKMKEFSRALDEQEEQRAQELAQRMAKQDEMVKKLQANSEGGVQLPDQAQARANAQQEEQTRFFFEAEAVKQNRLKQMRLENQAYLLKQMEDKDSRKVEEQYIQGVQAQIFKKDTELYEQMEKKKVIDRRALLQEHRTEILKQMEYKARQSVPEMTESEIRMNAPLLNLVTKTLAARDEQFCD